MIVFAFLFGLIFGSFANVILVRLNTGESIVTKGSRCFSCAKKLKWFDLVPIVSFFALRGRCRFCKSKISIQYPIVELGTGILFLLLFLNFYFGFDLLFGFWHLSLERFLILGYWLLIVAAWYMLWVASLYDLRHMILPDRLLIFAFFFGVAALGVSYVLPLTHNPFLITHSLSPITHYSLLYQFGAAFLASLFFFFLWFLSHGKWMGLGDAKFVFVLAPLFSPLLLLIALMLSFVIGTIASVSLLLFRKADMKTKVPFGPFLFLGALISFLGGTPIFDWYLGLFM
ncbi:MAG: prepilin peptidase [bacterium]|nr:prepilin peptidase [bacterium]